MLGKASEDMKKQQESVSSQAEQSKLPTTPTLQSDEDTIQDINTASKPNPQRHRLSTADLRITLSDSPTSTTTQAGTIFASGQYTPASSPFTDDISFKRCRRTIASALDFRSQPSKRGSSLSGSTDPDLVPDVPTEQLFKAIERYNMGEWLDDIAVYDRLRLLSDHKTRCIPD